METNTKTRATKIKINMIRISITIKAIKSGRMPTHSFSIFRGMFGKEIRDITCLNQGVKCHDCSFLKNCGYGSVFEPTSEIFAPEYIKINKFLPPPVIIKSPTFNNQNWQKGEVKKIELTFFGEAVSSAHLFLQSLYTIGEINGVGPDRILFKVSEVEQIHQNKSTSTLKASEIIDDLLFTQQWLWNGQSQQPSKIMVNINTPLRLQQGGKLVRSVNKNLFINSVLRRVNYLTSLYGSIILPDSNTLTEKVEIIEDNSKWISLERYSGRQKKRMDFGGIIGSFYIKGDFSELLPLLKCASDVHIGKQTNFGFGEFEIWELL